MFKNLFGLLVVLWGGTLWERWILAIIGVAIAMHFNFIAVTFNALLIALIAIAILVIIRIIAKGVFLNGDIE